VELTVEEAAWNVPKPSPKNQHIVHIAIALSEGALRPQMKQCSRRRNPQRGLWEVRDEHVLALG
jgi:hypothetical protein